MEHGRKNSIKGTSEILRTKTCRIATFFHNKSHTEWPFLKAVFCSKRLANSSVSHGTAFYRVSLLHFPTTVGYRIVFVTTVLQIMNVHKSVEYSRSINLK